MPSPAAQPARCSIAVFAHNEAPRIAATLRSIEAAAQGMAVEVVVLANGCQDGTAQVVRGLMAASPHVRVVEIAMADKANAWNTYVHTVATTPTLHVFVDGDVQVAPVPCGRWPSVWSRCLRPMPWAACPPPVATARAGASAC